MENNNDTNKRYWKSVEEFSDQEVFNAEAEKEFLSSPLSETDTGDGVARRDFLKLMGASLALASTACVRRPVQNIVPYANRPEGMILGKPEFYASSLFDNGHAYATLVKTREGRPIKLEGNPSFPINQGGLSARAQAHVLSLYDPDRLQEPHTRLAADKDFHKRVWDIGNWEKVDAEIAKLVGEGKVALLTASQPSPSTKAVMDDFTSTFKAKHYIYDSINHDDVLMGQKASYGQSIFPRYRFENAKYVVSVGADFLGTYGNPVEYAKGFSQNRKPDAEMSKLIVFESLMSLTGANSDYRIPVKSSDYIKILLGLANEIVVKQGKSKYAGDGAVRDTLKKYSNAAAEAGLDTALFSKIAEEMWANRGQSLVITGGLNAKTENATDLQIAANFLNSLLENDGKTVDGKFHNMSYAGYDSSLTDLVADINSGKIDVVVISGVNPVYAAPTSLKLVEAFKKVKVVYSTQYMDETAKIADYVLAESHALEAWGDFEFQDGLFAIQQPTIRPLHATRPFQFNLMTWAYTLEKGPSRLKDTETWYDFVKNYWKDKIVKGSTGGKSFDDYWTELLKQGFIDQSASARKQTSSGRSFQISALKSIAAPTASTGFELNLYPKIAIGDGTYNNISFLQELPDPITKVTWDNYLTISYKTAKSEGLKDGDVVSLKVGDEEIQIPVFVQVGQEVNTLGLAVGYGKSFGRVGNGIGKNAFSLQKMGTQNYVTAGLSASFKKLGKKYPLANAQGHHHMESRMIVAEATLHDYMKNKSSGIHRHKVFSIWPKHEYKGHKWGMAIDQNSCTGCSACVVACQSENNIPVVGKQYVIEGREMQWIRIDRYYSGSSLHNDIPDSPDVYFQPQLCQHCDNAPCETVCPVLATTHSPEGLNEMTYNRCVGTRYCSNNCPYKARRFNWFAFTKGDRDLDTPKEAYNPGVTVRSRGVMEKCTFCVHRITEVKKEAKLAGAELKDGDIQTACEESCPSNAIVFGDMNDPNSRVSKMQKQERAYKVLEEVHAEPSVRYLTKIRNKDSVSTGGHGGNH